MSDETDPSPEELHEVMRTVQVRMQQLAFDHFPKIGARTLRVLQDLELYSDSTEPLGVDVDLDVLMDPTHSRRENLGPGPLVLYRIEGVSPSRTILELPMLVYSDSREIRAAAMEEWGRYFAGPGMNATPKTLDVVKQYREDLISDDPAKWRRASVAISDALNEDILISMAGMMQSLECEPVIKDCLNSFTRKVLHPTIPSLDSIQLVAGNGERDRGVLESFLKETVERSKSLESLFVNYMSALGFLPLAPLYGLSAAVTQWLEHHAVENIYESLWAWADHARSPLAVYHACTVFVANPDWIPEGKIGDLWKRIVSVVDQKQAQDKDDPSKAPWTLRRDLAKHYAYHLEARLPDHDSAPIAVFAWWLAEQVAQALTDDPESAHFYHENWVRSAFDRSSSTWMTASPPVQASFLRFITHTSSCPWATALLTQLGHELHKLAPGTLPEPLKTHFQDGLVASLLSSLPLSLATPESPMYAQQGSMADIALKWSEFCDQGNRDALQQLIKMSRELSENKGLCKALRELDKVTLVNQAAICMAFKGKVLQDPSIGPSVWEILSDSDWRKTVLSNLDTPILGVLIETLMLLAVQHGEQWFYELPHIVAEVCENADNDDRRRTLFHCVLYLSLASDTVSSILRLLRGDQKKLFVPLVKEFRDAVDSMRGLYPSWVQGKLRALMASLHLV